MNAKLGVAEQATTGESLLLDGSSSSASHSDGHKIRTKLLGPLTFARPKTPLLTPADALRIIQLSKWACNSDDNAHQIVCCTYMHYKASQKLLCSMLTASG